MKILTDVQEKVLKRERSFLTDLRVKLVGFDADKADFDAGMVHLSTG